jgi:hypothetical protein
MDLMFIMGFCLLVEIYLFDVIIFGEEQRQVNCI